MAALARISEKASQPLAPALAAYARSAGAIPQLRKFFAGAPATRDKTLEILSADPANANLVLALAPPLPLHQLPPPAWQVVLVRALVTGGNYAGVAAEADRVKLLQAIETTPFFNYSVPKKVQKINLIVEDVQNADQNAKP